MYTYTVSNNDCIPLLEVDSVMITEEKSPWSNLCWVLRAITSDSNFLIFACTSLAVSIPIQNRGAVVKPGTMEMEMEMETEMEMEM